MKKLIKGIFSINAYKPGGVAPDPKAITKPLIEWADEKYQALEVYTLENDPEIYVDFRIVADSASMCRALLKELKNKARRWGSITLRTEMTGSTWE